MLACFAVLNPIHSKIILSLFSSSSLLLLLPLLSPCVQRLTQAPSAEESHAVLHDYVDNDFLGCSNENDAYHVRLMTFVILNDLFCTLPTLKLLTYLICILPVCFVYKGLNDAKMEAYCILPLGPFVS